MTNVMTFKMNVNLFTPNWVFAQYVNCAAANPGADAGMYDAS